MADGAGACGVYPEDEGGDFGGGREGDVRAEPKPSRYLTFQDFMLVGFKGGGKTSRLIKFLVWWTTAFCLCLSLSSAPMRAQDTRQSIPIRITGVFSGGCIGLKGGAVRSVARCFFPGLHRDDFRAVGSALTIK